MHFLAGLAALRDYVLVFIPLITTVQALRVVHAQHPAALRAGPFEGFHFNEILDAKFLDGQQIGDRARGIFGSIAFVKMGHTITREFVAVVTIGQFPIQ
jgi:hypothetical protein